MGDAGPGVAGRLDEMGLEASNGASSAASCGKRGAPSLGAAIASAYAKSAGFEQPVGTMSMAAISWSRFCCMGVSPMLACITPDGSDRHGPAMFSKAAHGDPRLLTADAGSIKEELASCRRTEVLGAADPSRLHWTSCEEGWDAACRRCCNLG